MPGSSNLWVSCADPRRPGSAERTQRIARAPQEARCLRGIQIADGGTREESQPWRRRTSAGKHHGRVKSATSGYTLQIRALLAQPRAHRVAVPAPRHRSAHRLRITGSPIRLSTLSRNSAFASSLAPYSTSDTGSHQRPADLRRDLGKQRVFRPRQVILRQFGDLREQPASGFVVEQLRRQRLWCPAADRPARDRDDCRPPPESGRSHQAWIVFPVQTSAARRTPLNCQRLSGWKKLR